MTSRRLHWGALVVALLYVGAATGGAQQPAGTPAAPDYSIDRFYSLPSLIGTEPRGMAWAPDGRTLAFLWNDEGLPFLDVFVARVVPGQPLRPERVTRLPRPDIPATTPPSWDAQRTAIAAELDEGVSSVTWHPDGRRLLYAFRGDLWLVTPGGEPTQLTTTPGAEQRATFDASGSRLAFLRGGDLWVAALRDNTLAAPTRLTTLVREGVGVESFTWAADGRTFAITETDRTPIATRRIPDYLPDEATVTEVRRAYPGEPSEHRRVGLVADTGGTPRWLELGGDPSDVLFTVAFSPNSSTLLVDKSDVFVKDRRLFAVPVATGDARLLVREQEADNVSAEWRAAWAPDGRSVYFTSDRAHDYHVWQVDATGGAPRAITSGPWAVFGFSVTPRGLVVVANEGRPEERHLYRVPLRGGAVTRVSVRPGTHTPVVSPDGRVAAVLFSSDTVPPDLFVTDLVAARAALTGEQRLTTSPRAEFAAYRWPTPRYVTFTSRADGATVHGRLLLPPGYTPDRRWPVVVGSIYSNTVRNQWGGRNSHPLWGFDRVLLEKGYVVFALDVAGSSGHGTDFRRRIRLDYGGIDVEDIHSGVEWLIAQGIADASRIGIWGSSYGGLLTSMSLFTKPGVFRAGIAAAPATNVLHALTGEQRVMDRPQERPGEYASASSSTKAAGLQGSLMLLHGMRDVVVLYRDSVWLLQYLMQLGRDVELVTLPDAPHGWDLGPRYQTRYAFDRMLEYLDRHLTPERPSPP
jgi:dipeptidyl-peptidase 4